jgi:hypothetical protein
MAAIFFLVFGVEGAYIFIQENRTHGVTAA